MTGIVLHEDRVAAVALGKTVAFLLYSLLTFPVIASLDVFLGWGDRHPWLLNGVFVALEGALFFVVFRGYLPGTSGRNARPFNEHQLALGCAVVSAALWMLPLAAESYRIIGLVLNGALLIASLVYFVVKSIISRRPRWAVLAVAVIPAMQLLGIP